MKNYNKNHVEQENTFLNKVQCIKNDFGGNTGCLLDEGPCEFKNILFVFKKKKSTIVFLTLSQ